MIRATFLLSYCGFGLLHGASFEKPVLLEADGKPIQIRGAGYSCPTLVDIDKDGQKDLVVGRYSNGALLYYKNIAKKNAVLSFAKGQPLKSGDKAVRVPGVW